MASRPIPVYTSAAATTTASTRPGPRTSTRSPESHMSVEIRNNAAQVLQSYQWLSWWSFARSESIAQTRLHFQSLVAGFNSDDEASLVDWKEDCSPHPPKPGEEASGSKGGRKGKERASLPGAGNGDAVAGPSSPPPTVGKGKGREKSEAAGTAGGSANAVKKKRKSGGGGER
ncbi:hypothetical protein LTR08_004298 [Meristemomyces frigidus]|nr:hypothetical protein LTR08_004298 [Meristemomyces frigidus]